MTLSKSEIFSLVAQLNSSDETEAKTAASALDFLLYPKFSGMFTAAEGRRIDDEHYGAIRGSDAIEPLLDALRGGTEFARAYAARVLGTITDPRAVPLLVEALSATSPVVRSAAANGIWVFRDPSTVPALVHVLLHDVSPEVCRSAAFALGLIRSAEAVPALMAFYENGDKEAKVSALHALGKICDPRSLPLARAALLDRVRKIRDAAKSTLANYDLRRREREEPTR